MNAPSLPRAAGTASLLAALMTGCIFDQANRGTIVDNEVRVGILFLADGSTPAANAKVKAFPVGHQPDTSAQSGDPAYATSTNAQGRYSMKLAKGQYNILGEKDGAYSYQDSIFFGADDGSLLPDTLSKPGSVAGVVGLQPNHDPISCLVQVLGTQSYVNVGKDGRFRLDNLAAGRYTLRVYSTFAEYVPLVVPVRVTSGRDDTLPDTLRLPFTGVPVVTGLKAGYDTAAAVVKLSWTPVQYRDFSEYLVYRDEKGVLTPSSRPVGSTTSPNFSDTLLYRDDGFQNPGMTGSLGFEYRVRVRNKSDQVGLTYGKIAVEAAGPGLVRVAGAISVVGTSWDSVRRAERVVLVADLRSPKRGMDSIQWVAGPSDSLLATHGLRGALTASDTVVFFWSHPGPVTVQAWVRDAAGSVIPFALQVPLNSLPLVRVPLDAEIDLRSGSFDSADLGAEDPDGDPLRYTLVNAPSWLTLSDAGILRSAATNAEAGRHPGIKVLIFDGRRTLERGPFTVAVLASAWRFLPTTREVSQSSQAVTVGSRVYLLGADENEPRKMYSFTRSAKAWTPEPPLPLDVYDYSVQAVDGVFYLLGGRFWDSTANATRFNGDVWAFDTATHSWTRKKPSAIGFVRALSAVVNGKIHMISGGAGIGEPFASAVAVYDPAADSWTSKAPIPKELFAPNVLPLNAQAVALGGKIYTMGWTTSYSFIPSEKAAVYDPATDTWKPIKSMSAPRTFLSAGTVGGKIYAVGGFNPGTDHATLEAYDPATDTWTRKAPLPRPVNMAASAVVGGEFLLFQGSVLGISSNTCYSYDPALDP